MIEDENIEFCESLLRQNDFSLHELFPFSDEEELSKIYAIFDNSDMESAGLKAALLHLISPGQYCDKLASFYSGNDDYPRDEKTKLRLIAALMSSYGFYAVARNFYGIVMQLYEIKNAKKIISFPAERKTPQHIAYRIAAGKHKGYYVPLAEGEEYEEPKGTVTFYVHGEQTLRVLFDFAGNVRASTDYTLVLFSCAEKKEYAITLMRREDTIGQLDSGGRKIDVSEGFNILEFKKKGG